MQGKCLFIVVRFGQAFDLTYMRSANPRSKLRGMRSLSMFNGLIGNEILEVV